MSDYPQRSYHPKEIEHFIDKAIKAVSELEFIHATVVTPSRVAKTSQAPDDTLVGNATPGLLFTKNTDAAARLFKISPGYVHGSANFHIHWTKSTDTDDLDKTVRWRVTINTSSHGNSDDLTETPTVFEVEDSYPSSDETGRIFMTTEFVPLDSVLSEGDYVSLKIEAITPLTGEELSEPVLIALDFTYYRNIHLV